MVEEAINRIPNWQGSPVRIKMEPGDDFAPGNSATIIVGNNAYFSLFPNDNGKFEIEDIIEGGEEDEEFFSNPKYKSDYYALINEITTPGISQKGKILTLYTARPKKDREFYLNTTYLPANIFLTNSPGHADGLAHDLSSGEPRDIWQVKIDSKYLTKTLNGPIKYYQVSAEKAPVRSIGLY